MSALKAYFDSTVNQYSPTRGDLQRVVNYDDDGNEFITYEEVDYPALVASRGKVSDWSLDALLAAGIDPKFGVHTGFNTRLEGLGVLDDAQAYVDALFADDVTENKE